ncbi:1-aminocyclopropane-1-carboxylate synthase-like protein 1 [Smittium culicis]|uniref:1-aminocyclopropane-1-carboxylate synthase-like protein 1 n=1 Tax=Smittium culicis TaxID=133412 RepID=A0A1R1YGA7_9FUNG|nr:1-aminocyclopropane-1-carboxylate synthase-like protein 1 [Smittium culicis]
MSTKLVFSNAAIENLNDSNASLEAIGEAMNDQYDEVANPNGIMNLGIAVNKLQEEIILKKLNSINTVTKKDLEYNTAFGTETLRTNISNMINKNFNPVNPVNKDDIVVTNGATSALDKLASVLCNPGEAILISSPYYSVFETDLNLVAKAVVHNVPVPVSEIQSPVQVRYYQKKLDELNGKGITTKAIVVCNPHNPTGKCYSRAAVEAILEFANRNKLFVIMDEIYALSVFRNTESASDLKNDKIKHAGDLNDAVGTYSDNKYEFESVLSFENLSELIDPSLVIVLHGLSKDFCLNGFRVGWVVSPFNKQVVTALCKIAMFSYQAGLVDSIISKLLGDTEFLDSFNVILRKNLLESYERTTTYLNNKNIKYVPSQAGHFLWINIQPLMIRWKNNNLRKNQFRITSPSELTFDDDMEMWLSVIKDARIYYTAGVNFKSDEPGWIRLIFSQPWDFLKKGLDRLFDYIEKESNSIPQIKSKI